MNLFQFPGLNVRIDLGGLDARMTEQFLNHPQIGTARQEMGRKAVAQRVRRNFVGNANSLGVSLYQLPYSLTAQPLARP